ncbi:MAG: hypothetical protein ACI389_02265 [Methanobrevibacter sp.]|uniref:hypothetical protein n=1 Tax=Methanobrevibacter sp. TaxID=66852 RepID=UPI003F0A2CDD
MKRSLDEMVEKVLEIIEACLIHEKESSDGLLNHVKTIISVYNNEYGVDEPAIWIVQHPTTRKGDDNLSQSLLVNSTIEFVCVEWDKDPRIAEKKARELATKVAKSIKKNYRKIQYAKFNDRIIKNVKFNTLYPVGEIDVEGKTQKTPVAGIILDFEFIIDWINCC